MQIHSSLWYEIRMEILNNHFVVVKSSYFQKQTHDHQSHFVIFLQVSVYLWKSINSNFWIVYKVWILIDFCSNWWDGLLSNIDHIRSHDNNWIKCDDELRSKQVFSLSVTLQMYSSFVEGLLEHLGEGFQLLREKAVDEFLWRNSLNAQCCIFSYQILDDFQSLRETHV